MCTALTHHTKDHYFGRNLDLEYSFREEVVITPRNHPFEFRTGKTLQHHYAWIGMATIADGYPLYYDATNEFGLSIAGLNFPGNAVYYPPSDSIQNIAPFELSPWLLGQCKNISDVKTLLEQINIVDIPFSKEYPLSPLHWIIADQNDSITLETLAGGMKVYENPI